MSPPSSRSHVSPSYYARRAHWISTAPTQLQSQELKSLFTCFLTIRDFRDLLYDPKVNLAKDINDKFINDIMLRDFGLVIVALRDYRGAIRRGVKEALEIMDDALKKLYSAFIAFTKKNAYQRDNTKVQALLVCRGRLQDAYLHLEYLNGLLKKHYSMLE